MPLVRIDLMKKPDASFAQRVGQVVYESMKSSIGVPDHDNFQVITEHDAQHLIFDTSYLGIERTHTLGAVRAVTSTTNNHSGPTLSAAGMA